MALYPSLEDLVVDQLMKAQTDTRNDNQNGTTQYEISAPRSNFYTSTAANSTTDFNNLYSTTDFNNVYSTKNPPVYPSLGDYMGLELSHDVIAANMPEYLQSSHEHKVLQSANLSAQPESKMDSFVAPLSGQSIGLKKAPVNNGIRELVLCKNAEGKVGFKMQPINNGIFVSLVIKDSPSAMAGLRFGDQILQVNGINVAGFTMEKVQDLFKKSPVNGISVIVRDRPFERSVTLHKDSTGRIGFSIKDGKIINIVLDSSAARNGVLTDHNLLEVNGQNVVGLNDKEIIKIITNGGNIITVTIIPSFIYQHMIKKISSSVLSGKMDRSIPTF